MVNKVALIVAFLSVITMGGVTNKLSYQIADVGSPEYPAHFFKKPWFLELLMFIGMSFSFPVFWAMNYCTRTTKVEALATPLTDQAPQPNIWRIRALIFIPAMGDLLGSILSFTGLVYISNSTAQMLGSSIIVLVAFNSYIFLGRRFNKIQYLGMGTVLGSLVIIGYAASVAAHDMEKSGSTLKEASPADQAFGMFLCVCARAVNSVQYILEEKIMGDCTLHPLQVVGTEGIYGLLLTACVIMPILANIPGHDVGGVFENTRDSIEMVKRNSTLDLVLFMYLLGLWGLNALGMMVMKHLGAVFRAVSRNLQALFVWLIDMVLFYQLGPEGFGYGPVGEPWKGRGSWLQVVGFVFMSAGVMMYAYGNAVQQAAVVALPSPDGRPIPSPSLKEVVSAEMRKDFVSPAVLERTRTRSRAGSNAEFVVI